MKIDRSRALKAFEEYVEGYDCTDEKVRLKVEHTYRVSSLCERIAGRIGMCREDMDLAWLVGLLHDIGRFEQLKNYGTFIDAQSIDHAEYGAGILFGKEGVRGKIRDFIQEGEEDSLLKTAVACHSMFRIPENLEERTGKFVHIIRDADKVDILKVNVDFPLEEIYNVTTRELREGQVTGAVMDSFRKETAVLRSLKRTAVDHVVGHISLVYELVFPVSLSIVVKQGYLDKLMNFESQNPVTCGQFQRIREKMGEYLADKVESEKTEAGVGNG